MQWQPSCFVPTGGLTDIMQLIVAIRNFANAPNWTPRNRSQRAMTVYHAGKASRYSQRPIRLLLTASSRVISADNRALWTAGGCCLEQSECWRSCQQRTELDVWESAWLGSDWLDSCGIGVRFPARIEVFSSSLGPTHRPDIKWLLVVPFPRLKRPGREAQLTSVYWRGFHTPNVTSIEGSGRGLF